MNTPIAVEYPWSQLYSKGYVATGIDGRKRVSLFSDSGENRYVSYARYLFTVHLKQFIPDHLTVDHINDDKTDDRVENFQLLTDEENRMKEYYRYLTMEYSRWAFTCACCEVQFLLTEREINMRLAQGVEYAFCSKSCSAFYHWTVTGQSRNSKSLDMEKVARVKTLRAYGHSSYKIAEMTGIPRSTVARLMNI